MIGEIPRRFKGTPRDFLDSAYYLSQYKITDGVFWMGYPSITEATAKISIGEHGWALAQRLPEGGCAITVAVEGEDEAMWQTHYSYLERRGWFDVSNDVASEVAERQTEEARENAATLGSRTPVLIFDGEFAKYPEELFRIAFEVSDGIQLPGASSGKSGVDIPPDSLRGIHKMTRIRILEARLQVNEQDDGRIGLSTDEDFVVGYVSVQPKTDGGARVLIEQLDEPKATRRVIGEDATGKTYEKVQPTLDESAATISIISEEGFDRTVWFEHFVYLFLLQADGSQRASTWFRATGHANNLVELAHYEESRLHLSAGYTMAHYLADRDKAIAFQKKKMIERGEQAAVLLAGRCKDEQKLVALVETFVCKQLPPHMEGSEPTMHSGLVKLLGESVPKQYNIFATVRGFGEIAIGHLEISPANDTDYDFELVRYGNDFPDRWPFDFQRVRELFDALAEKIRNNYATGSTASTDAPSIAQTLRIFVSGTMEDMKPEREAVARAIASLRLSPVRAETEFSEDQASREKVLSMVRECDIFLGLYNQTRYGWVIPSDGISVTELEFDEAQASHKPTLIFIKRLPQGWQPQDESGKGQREKQAAFTRKVLDFENGRFRGPEFESLAHLREQVVASLVNLLVQRYKLTVTGSPSEILDGVRTVALDDARQELPTQGLKLVWTDHTPSPIEGLPNLRTPLDLPASNNPNIVFEDLVWEVVDENLAEASYRFFRVQQFEHDDWRWFKVDSPGQDKTVVQIIGNRDGIDAHITIRVRRSKLSVESDYHDWEVLQKAYEVFRQFLITQGYVRRQRKRILGLRLDFLLLAIGLSIVISLGSLLQYPNWAQSIPALALLLAFAFYAAIDVIGKLRKLE
jgi:hypothetical protein